MSSDDTATKTFTVYNPTASLISVDVSDHTLVQVHETTFTLVFSSGYVPMMGLPTYVQEISSDINTYDPDLVRAQVILPYSVFDVGSDYSYDNRWRVMLYDWKDMNIDVKPLYREAEGIEARIKSIQKQAKTTAKKKAPIPQMYG